MAARRNFQGKKFKDYQIENAELKAELSELRQKLDKELEWKPSRRTGTQMDQKRYEELLHCTSDNGSSRVMSEEEVKELLFEECGFSPDKIEIVTKVAAYEVKKYRQLRKSAEYDRQPLYGSTDWNYIRFNCQSFMWEFINGELEPYCC